MGFPGTRVYGCFSGGQNIQTGYTTLASGVWVQFTDLRSGTEDCWKVFWGRWESQSELNLELPYLWALQTPASDLVESPKNLVIWTLWSPFLGEGIESQRNEKKLTHSLNQSLPYHHLKCAKHSTRPWGERKEMGWGVSKKEANENILIIIVWCVHEKNVEGEWLAASPPFSVASLCHIILQSSIYTHRHWPMWVLL